MFCFLAASSLGPDAWRIFRAVEIIGYHATDRTIKILLALIVENKMCIRDRYRVKDLRNSQPL